MNKLRKTDMALPITYSLRVEEPSSENYYQDIANFIDKWLPGAVARYAEIIHAFRDQQGNTSQLRTDEEYFLEFLSLSVMLQEQLSNASQQPLILLWILKYLVQFQDHHPQKAVQIKRLRGWIGGLASFSKIKFPVKEPLPRLFLYLEAMGESGYVNRLTAWKNYILSQDTMTILDRCHALGNEFAAIITPLFAKHAVKITSFIEKARIDYRWQYDRYFVTRTPLQYYLSMIGIEILNHAYRRRFLETDKKIVILPPCMKAKPDDLCQAINTPFGARCQACTPTCRVNQITQEGMKENYEVFLIPEELRTFNTGTDKKTTPIGVLGVSCLLTNMPGGWDADTLGIPAQGLPLDYVGCSYHWHPDGIPTDLNIERIRKILSTD